MVRLFLASVAVAVVWSGALLAAEDGGEGPLPGVEARTQQDDRFYRVVTEEEVNRMLEIKTRPVQSPISGKVIHVPVEDPVSNDRDSDHCPHLTGRVKFYSPIVLDPDTGFAAYREHFGKPQSAAVKAWVRGQLTPRWQRVLRQMVSTDVKVDPGALKRHFSRQENLPDIVRCEHALAYYTHIKSSAAVRARLAWLTAWAYRRAICDTIEGPFLMQSVLQVVKAMDAGRSDEKDIQARINRLADLYEAKEASGAPRFSILEQQLVRILLGGEYDRLGMTAWSRSSLEEAARVSGTPPQGSSADDPWLRNLPGKPEEKMMIASQQRKAVFETTQVRLAMLKKEIKYLGLASSLIQEALREGQYPPERRTFFIYLVGEFERRQENYGKAKLWLDAAEALLGEPGEGNTASEQLVLLKDYVSRNRDKVDLGYKDYAKDHAFLQQQIRLIREAGTGEEGDAGTIRSGAAPAGGRPPRTR